MICPRLCRCSRVATPCALAMLTLLAGCRDWAPTWSTRVTSPDSTWVASAESVQNGGPGTAADYTSVSLSRPGKKPVEVLLFNHQYATMTLQMRWLTPTDLQVDYGPSSRPGDTVTVDFQAVKLGPVSISLHRLADNSPR